MDLLLLTVGIGLLWWGGEWLVDGASALARSWGLSPLVIGLTVVAFGTSAPELAATLAAALRGAPAIAFGNVVGSNTANLGLILGTVTLIGPLVPQALFIKREVPVMLVASVLFAALALDGATGRVEGLVLMVLIVPYLFYLLKSDAEPPAVEAEYAEHFDEDTTPTGRALVLTVVGIGFLVLGAHWLVEGAVGIAQSLGVPERVIGITLVAFGTSLPELAAGIVAVLKREGDIVLGNIIGSNIFNIFLIYGTTCLVHPVTVNAAEARIDLMVMLALTVLTSVLLATGDRMRRPEGAILLAAYVGYVVWLVV